MKGNLARLVFTLLALVIGTALEELLPHFGGVGFPLLLAFALFAAEKWSVPAMVLVAIAAGGCEDAVSSLPYLSGMMFNLLSGSAVRWSRSPKTCALAAYPAYQFWLTLWGSSGFVAALPRFLLALPVGAVTVLAVSKLCAFASERAGIE